MNKVPMRPGCTLTSQINIKIDPNLKADILVLKGMGVDIGKVLREAVKTAVNETLREIGTNSTAQVS